MPDDTIVLKVPAGTKARLVHEANRRGMKLSDYILWAIDRPANKFARTPCPRCDSVLLVSDGPGYWQCGQCGLES